MFQDRELRFHIQMDAQISERLLQVDQGNAFLGHLPQGSRQIDSEASGAGAAFGRCYAEDLSKGFCSSLFFLFHKVSLDRSCETDGFDRLRKKFTRSGTHCLNNQIGVLAFCTDQYPGLGQREVQQVDTFHGMGRILHVDQKNVRGVFHQERKVSAPGTVPIEL